MKAETLATFKFAYKESLSKEEAHSKLEEFLQRNEWLKGSLLRSYHSEKDGICEVIIENSGDDKTTKESAEEFFSDLCDDAEVKWVSVIKSEPVNDLVFRYVDRYPEHQSFDIVDMKDGDEVVILYRKK